MSPELKKKKILPKIKIKIKLTVFLCLLEICSLFITLHIIVARFLLVRVKEINISFLKGSLQVYVKIISKYYINVSSDINCGHILIITPFHFLNFMRE